MSKQILQKEEKLPDRQKQLMYIAKLPSILVRSRSRATNNALVTVVASTAIQIKPRLLIVTANNIVNANRLRRQ